MGGAPSRGGGGAMASTWTPISTREMFYDENTSSYIM